MSDGNYGSAEVSIGASRECRNNTAAIAKTHRAIVDECEAIVATRIEAIQDVWQEASGQ